MRLRMSVLYKFLIVERTLFEELRLLCIFKLVINCFMLVLISLSQFNLFKFIFPLVLEGLSLMPDYKRVDYSWERDAIERWFFEG